MNIKFIEEKFEEIYKELEKDVMKILNDQSMDRKETNLRVKPYSATKQILKNALDSIKLANKIAKENLEKENYK